MNDSYQALYHSFRWLVPTQFNIAEVCCHRWATSSSDGRRIAIYYEDDTGHREVWTYHRLAEAVKQLANGLRRMGVGKGDRVSVILGQRPEAVVVHMATYSIGAIIVPLSVLEEQETLAAQLRHAEVRVAVTDTTSSVKLLAVAEECPALQQIIGIGFANEHILPWRSLLARQPSEFKPVATLATDPALLFYKPGTTEGNQGVLLSHAALIGHLPGFVASQDWFPKAGDVFWSPVDWAEAQGVMNALLPTLYFGHSIVSTAEPFSPERACQLMERYQITNAFLDAMTLTAIMQTLPTPRTHYRLALRALMSMGKSIDKTMFEWCRAELGVTPNVAFGQTEMNYCLGNSRHRWPVLSGSLGRPYPGHQVAIIDDQGQRVAPGKIGEIALNRYDTTGHLDPVLFLGYWHNPVATATKFTEEWCRSGDLAYVDEDGYFWPADGRDDDRQSAVETAGPEKGCH
jgi:acetyl-CoA synthetase